VTGSGNLPPQPPSKGGSLGSKTTTKPKPLTKAQQLAKALRSCKKLKSHKKRTRCEAQARKRYGPKPKPKKPARRARRGGRRG
jgi:hypothetical protein